MGCVLVKRSKKIVINLRSDGHSKLSSCLTNRVTIAGKNSLIGKLNALASLLDGHFLSLLGKLSDADVSALGYILSIADGIVVRKYDGRTWYANKIIIDGCKRCELDSVEELLINHLSDDFRAKKIG